MRLICRLHPILIINPLHIITIYIRRTLLHEGIRTLTAEHFSVYVFYVMYKIV